MAATSNLIRFVTLDALYTIIKPRDPIPVQYAEAFAAAGLGTLDPDAVGRSFKAAYKHVDSIMPAGSGHRRGENPFWSEIISRAAIGAGAEVDATEAALPTLVPALMHQFSSREGYELYKDVKPSLDRLSKLGRRPGLVSNGDGRILNVLSSLGVLDDIYPRLLSDDEGIAKPDKRIFQEAAYKAGVEVHQVVHVGDEVENDYRGAEGAGMHALLLRRGGKDDDAAHEDRNEENLKGVTVVRSLIEAADWIEVYNNSKATCHD